MTAALFLAAVLRSLEAHYSLDILTYPENILRLAIVVIICELALYYYDLYDLQIVSRRSVLFVHLMQALGAACLWLAVLYFCAPSLTLGRGVAALAAPIILILVLSWRLLLAAFAPLRRPERLLILGTAAAGVTLVRKLVSTASFNMKVVGFLDEEGKDIGKPLVNPGIIAGCSDVEQIVAGEKIDRVVISLAERRGRMPVRELLRLKLAGVRIEDVHSLSERIMGKIMLEHLTPSWLILSDGFRKSELLLVMKRAMDILISTLILLITWPFILLLCAAIWLETGGPILFGQRRVGAGGREFEILKLRSMYQNSEQQGPSWTASADRRVTRVGRFLRRYRLDELPQLINVLRGEMSIVGPRPEQPYFCELLEKNIPFYGLRHAVRPGITGWAQVRFQYSSSAEDTRTKLEYDLFYIKHMSLLLDLAIMFETGKVLLSGRGAQ